MTKLGFGKNFYLLLVNTLIATITNMTVWFAIIFYIYLKTQAVISTAILSGVYLVSVAISGFWFGSLVDRFNKKKLMLVSSGITLIIFIAGFIIYQISGEQAFTSITSPVLWIFAILLLLGVITGNIRSIALPTIVTLMIPEQVRDRANGFVGTVTGVAFLVVSVISGILVGHSGMFMVLVIAIITTIITILHLFTIAIPENETIINNVSDLHSTRTPQIDIRGTLKAITSIPGLLTLILFTTFNNFLGGVFMALMDAYGLSLVSVQLWGILWGLLSTAFILGGLLIAKFGLGQNPLRTMFTANIIIWSICSVFTIQPSILLLLAGMFIYLCVVPFIEASEHTIIQKVVSVERQGRVFGFAQSIEQAASPLTAFLIGPIAQFIFIPFMTTGGGVDLIGDWYGVGPDRGIALVFTITGIVGLIFTILVLQSNFYDKLSKKYSQTKD